MGHFEFSTFPILETKRLKLRQIVAADAHSWAEALNHPDVMRYLIDFEQDTVDLDDVYGIIQWADNIFEQKTGLRWAITLKPDDTMIGSCGFHLYNQAQRCAEVGYELHQLYWRQGIMKEALGAILDFCFQRLNLHRVEADVTVGNEASAGLLQHMGFSLEGTWRDKAFARGKFHDLWQFGLLEGEIFS